MAVVANIQLDQGSVFNSTIDVEDVNGNPASLSGYTARGQVRKTYSSSTAVDFTAAITDASNGKVAISLTDTQTGGMKPGRYVYDVEVLSSSGAVTRIVEGQCEVMPRVTR